MADLYIQGKERRHQIYTNTQQKASISRRLTAAATAVPFRENEQRREQKPLLQSDTNRQRPSLFLATAPAARAAPTFSLSPPLFFFLLFLSSPSSPPPPSVSETTSVYEGPVPNNADGPATPPTMWKPPTAAAGAQVCCWDFAEKAVYSTIYFVRVGVNDGPSGHEGKKSQIACQDEVGLT